MKPRALISVSDKEGIVEFSQALIDLGYEIVSTGGTATLLQDKGLEITPIDDVTGFPECLDGRVKTLHPLVHGGILAIRDNQEHQKTMEELKITPIDLVVVNLYPFRKVIEQPNHTLAEAIENIDIGGPSMIRAAAKNHAFVTVVTEKEMYGEVLERIKNGSMTQEFRFALAVKAFAHTAAYDALIAEYLSDVLGEEQYPEIMTLTFEKKQDLRYGENPHQTAGYYQMLRNHACGIDKAVCLHGKELSYNNINDAQGAIALTMEFTEQPVCVAVKHSTPCGVGIGKTTLECFEKAFDADPISIFGGIVSFNREIDLATAEKLHEVFLEVIIAPSYTEEALECLMTKKNVRILTLDFAKYQENNDTRMEFKSEGGGLLIQETDTMIINDEELTTVTEKSPTSAEIEDLRFAMTVVKHVKSNAIVLVKDGQTVGIGGGSVSRIGAAEIAIKQAGEKAKGAVMASDAFFPFDDVVTVCGEAGVTAVIHPGGSKNDQLSISTCNKLGMSMVTTGVRHFRH